MISRNSSENHTKSTKTWYSGFQQAILELPRVFVLKQVLVQNFWCENEFDLHENEQVGRTHFHMNGFARRPETGHRGKRQFGNGLLSVEKVLLRFEISWVV